MEKVIVSKEQLELVKDYANDGYTLAELYDECNGRPNSEYGALIKSLGNDGIAKLWLGWYEVEKTLRERIIDLHNKILNDPTCDNSYSEGRRDALKWVVVEMDKDGEVK